VRRRVRQSFVIVSLLAFGALAFAPGAGAGAIGAAPLTIVKTVSGPVPAGTTFTATIECDGPIINDGEGGATALATVTFDATGQPTSADTVTFVDPGGCVVTETATGGAASTTYSCVAELPDIDEEVTPGSEFEGQQVPPEGGGCEAAGPQAGPMGVGIEFEDQSVTVTIANTFDEPTPAAQVVSQPAFTG
jgi:hypothetical protein